MKILLLGEFSGFFKNLKIGFQELGFDVTLIAQGDGWKNIDGADFSLDSKLKKPFKGIHIAFNYFKNLKHMKEYDIVLVINPSFFKKVIGNIILKYLTKHNKNIFLSACGDDLEFISFGLKGGFRFWPYMGLHGKSSIDRYQSNHEKNIHSNLLKYVVKIIPTSTMYKIAWDDSKYRKKVTNVVPMPINTDEIRHKPLKILEKNKIIFFHGLSRECFKGTQYIREAMNNIQIKYPDKVECIIEGSLPLNEYLKIIGKAHVVIDQCKSYDYNGMNTVYAMALGKVVMGGCQPEVLKEFSIDRCPIIGIEPNSKQIEEKMKFIIENKTKIEKWGMQSRRFVEKYHDVKVVSKIYMKLFEK
jgi:glycosyltransferase involved in cell wall biosynthesis